MANKTRSKELTELLQEQRENDYEQLIADNQSARAMAAQLEEQVDKRVAHARAEVEAVDEIVRLASELRRLGAEIPILVSKIKRFDRSDRQVKPITRQAFDLMMSSRNWNGAAPETTRAAPGERREQILSIVSENPSGITVSEIAKQLGARTDYLRQAANKLVEQGQLRRDNGQLLPPAKRRRRNTKPGGGVDLEALR